MRSSGWAVLGSGEILEPLREDLRAARSGVLVAGPWIDDYFIKHLITALPRGISLGVVTRPLSATGAKFRQAARAGWSRLAERPSTQLRTHDRLHAKVIILDRDMIYCGSANWYQYSLEGGCEVVLRGPLRDAPALERKMEEIWTEARTEPLRSARGTRGRGEARAAPIGIQEEIPDPIAAEVLKSVKGAFVLGRRSMPRKPGGRKKPS
jgi:hypothetical protein